MSPNEQEIQERHFVEEFGLLYEELGGSRMMGRIVGMMLICDPPHQSSQQLAEYLGASRGTISTLTRQLLQVGLLQKVPMPGSRATYFRMEDTGWSDMVQARIAYLKILQGVADRGLSILEGAPPERRKRLEHFKAFYDYLEREFQPIIDRWGARDPEEAT
ncbi:MAG TPA: MarR family transcriptional regulator [Deltaproteobacteria bacterium]|nr:MarR family transcriptional regulator [Deltaproteobacteria bacterium]